MNIQQIDQGSKGAFIIQEDNRTLAEMTYSHAGDSLIIIDHTEVSDALRGKGAGKQLVQAAVEYARSNQKKIHPLCSFAKKVFDSTPPYKEVLSK